MEHETAANGVYEKPQIKVYGNLAELTAGTHTGNTFDSSFHAGQPFRGSILSCVAPGPFQPCVTLPGPG